VGNIEICQMLVYVISSILVRLSEIVYDIPSEEAMFEENFHGSCYDRKMSRHNNDLINMNDL